MRMIQHHSLFVLIAAAVSNTTNSHAKHLRPGDVIPGVCALNNIAEHNLFVFKLRTGNFFFFFCSRNFEVTGYIQGMDSAQ